MRFSWPFSRFSLSSVSVWLFFWRDAIPTWFSRKRALLRSVHYTCVKWECLFSRFLLADASVAMTYNSNRGLGSKKRENGHVSVNTCVCHYESCVGFLVLYELTFFALQEMDDKLKLGVKGYLHTFLSKVRYEKCWFGSFWTIFR